MKINLINSINFKRRLHSSEEKEYTSVLKEAKEKASHGGGRSILIVPATSLPQNQKNNTGVGNLASEESGKFFDFVKKYWGINEIQILPMGHYHSNNGRYAPYSGTSTDLGNHVINLSDYVTEEELRQIVSENKAKDRVNYSNIVDLDSASEKVLKNVFKRINPEMKKEFELYKAEYAELLDRKSLYRALREIYGIHDYNAWGKTDRYLFDEDIICLADREKRIQEIKNLKGESIEFYKFKNFLAEKSLAKARTELNAKGIKLSGDMLLNFASEEVWSNPKAFIKDLRIDKWKFPVLDSESKEAEKVLRERVDLYARRYDGFRVDASWCYISPNVYNINTGVKSKLNNGDKFLKIIDDEVKKVKGAGYDLKNITHEFMADPSTEFNIYGIDGILKQSAREHVKIYTSDSLSENWGSAENFIKRKWGEDMFVLGAVNHDSQNMRPSNTQIDVLSKLLKIPTKKLTNLNEFIKAKFAEPMRAKNNMIFFLPALGIDANFKNNEDKKLNYTFKIPENYEEVYFKNLHGGFAYNPMDALEKQFVAQGLDKKEPDLFKKIVKYRKILEQKDGTAPRKKIIVGAVCIIIALSGIFYCLKARNNYSSK